jgi:carboxypeptidase Taq
MATAYEDLRQRLGMVYDLERVGELVAWDHLTQMPPAGSEARAHHSETLSRIHHELFADDETGRLIDTAASEIGDAGDESIEAGVVRVARRDWERARRVPTDLAGEIAHAAASGYTAWIEAREQSDFSHFLPALERNLELKQRYIACFEPTASPYDVLLEDYEPGMTSAEVTAVFDQLKPSLTPLVERVSGRQSRISDELLHRGYPAERQRAFMESLMRSLGATEDRWRLDKTVHPFACGISINDIRLTTRYLDENLASAFFGTIHEFGHGLYEAQVDVALERTPLGTGCSMTLHESQSRLWENLIGRGEPFSRYIAPILREQFPDQLGELDAAEFYQSVNKMSPSFIRVEADELTYGLHIILRYELELDLTEGRLAAKDLPEAWSAKMQQYFGLEVPDDVKGVMQDVHWSEGLFGYFPTYLLGTVLSVQIWDRMQADIADLDGQIESGSLDSTRDWLREHVHRYGRMFTPKETIEKAVGGPLDSAPYVNYLTEKVTALYGAA